MKATSIQSVDAPLRLRSRRLPDDWNAERAFSKVRGALNRAMQMDVIASGVRGGIHKRSSYALTETERLMVHFGLR